jgi:WXG100 family type VII secretion target
MGADLLDRITADFNALEQLESSFGNISEAIERLLGELRASITALNESWTGAANEAFQAAAQQWSRAADDIPERLNELQRLIVTARSNYQAAQDANLRTWGR